MQNGILKLTKNDLIKGGITAVIAAVVLCLGSIFSDPNFSLFSANWGYIGDQVFKVAVATFLGYLGKNLFTTNDGSFLGFTPKNKNLQ